MKKTLSGSSIREASTLGSMYDDNCIELTTRGGTAYRIDVSELVKVLKHFKFDTEEKRVHTYLLNPKKK